ncbi:hypothetical protein Gotur_007952 [Gossypium turneri]
MGERNRKRMDQFLFSIEEPTIILIVQEFYLALK